MSTMEVARFDWTDYSVFVFMLAFSVLIGIYFGCFGTKQKSVDEYILGGKDMNLIPVAISLVATTISGLTLIGVPAEVYTESTTYLVMVFALLIGCIFANYFLLPIFFELQITSVYEYLELRFSKQVRSVTSALYNMSCLLFLPAVIYMPSLSLSQVTGVNLHIISVCVVAVCVFYTMIGGLKAVLWTDLFQTVMTVLACLVIVTLGTINNGGFWHVMNTAYQDGKLNIFVMDPNPFQRTTFWTVFFGILTTWTSSLGTGQASVQRFMSLRRPKDVPIVLFIYWAGVSLLTTLSVYSGILIYSTYYGCDPIERKLINTPDQIFPYFVLDKVGYVPMLPGLFIAGVFSAALSTLSTSLNTIASTIYEDFIKSTGASEKKAQIIMKILIVIVGAISAALVLVIERMGKALSVSYILTGVTFAPVCVMFVCGMFIPWINTKGAIAAAVSSGSFLAWLSIGASVNKINFMQSSVYPVNTCPDNATEISSIANGILAYQNESYINNMNLTLDLSLTSVNQTLSDKEDDVFILYKLSFLLFMTFGMTVGVIAGLIVSFITGPTDLTMIDPVLISPPLRRFLPKKRLEIELQEKLMKKTDLYMNH